MIPWVTVLCPAAQRVAEMGHREIGLSDTKPIVRQGDTNTHCPPPGRKKRKPARCEDVPVWGFPGGREGPKWWPGLGRWVV